MQPSVAGKPYISLWPLPGGGYNFLDTLYKTLQWVAAQPDASFNDAQRWMQESYNLTGKSTALGYLETIKTMGYLSRNKDQLTITVAGRQFLKSKSRDLVTAGFLTECIGAWETLDSIRQLKNASLNAVHKVLKRQFPQWKSNSQPSWRVLWLLSLGCIEKTRGIYTITAYGLQALNTYKGPVVRGLVPAVPSPTEITHVSEPASEETIKVQATTKKGLAVEPPRILSRVAELIAEIEATAIASDEATEFEKTISKAFAYLGFEAQHKSGPGDTDVLLIAPLGQDTYRVVVDGKSSKHNKIQKTAVDWLALQNHRDMHNATFIMIVAPDFSTGDLYDNAKHTKAALLRAKDLCELLKLHYQTPFSLTDLRELFVVSGNPEHPLQQLTIRHQEITRLQQVISSIIQALLETGSYVDEPISMEGLYYIINMSRKKQAYSKNEIQEALLLLASPYIGALRQIGDHNYVLQMTSETILRRLQAQIRTLEHMQDTLEQ